MAVSLPIYLDHHATTPVDSRVLETMLPWFSKQFGNAASTNHAFGEAAADAVNHARKQVADLLGTESRCVVFTSGATEANNLAIKGVMRAARKKNHLVVTNAEHRAVLDPARRLRRQKFSVTELPVNNCGLIQPSQVAEAIRPETALVSVMFVNNEVGAINPVREIGEVCRQHGVLFHCDAVQAVSSLPIRFDDSPFDLISLTAHKIYGPKGIGALVIRDHGPRIPIEPLLDGGGHENRLRSGTLPVPLIVGFGAACEILSQERKQEAHRVSELRDQLWQGLRSRITGISLNGPQPPDRAAGNLNVSFANVDGDALLVAMQELAVSSGSACTSADPEPSHVLTAMGREEDLILASLRFGIGRTTTAAEIEYAIKYVQRAVEELRE